MNLSTSFISSAHSRPKVWRLTTACGLLVTDGLFFGLTNPTEVKGIILLIAFALIGLNIYGILRLVTYLLGVYGFIKIANSARHHRLAALVSVNAAIALALQSLGELTARDGVVLVLLGTVAYVYMTYGKQSGVNNGARSR